MLFEAVSLFFLIFTSLFGVASLLKLLFESLFGKNLDRILTVLAAHGREPGLECILRGQLRRATRPVAVVDFGMEEETRQIVDRLMLENDCLYLLAPEELAAWAEERRAQWGNAESEQAENSGK